ncbi:unnamed protein product [Protopolystoma xenopodis]|uniref:Uncharacterized protein n=1 Tax=Protopolystoma xenopodis TaxID=117903 RepID=A0A3S5AQE7_9PLAT|nr:unnamed protein product [Protopolystoma xenopodis]
MVCSDLLFQFALEQHEAGHRGIPPSPHVRLGSSPGRYRVCRCPRTTQEGPVPSNLSSLPCSSSVFSCSPSRCFLGGMSFSLERLPRLGSSGAGILSASASSEAQGSSSVSGVSLASPLFEPTPSSASPNHVGLLVWYNLLGAEAARRRHMPVVAGVGKALQTADKPRGALATSRQANETAPRRLSLTPGNSVDASMSFDWGGDSPLKCAAASNSAFHPPRSSPPPPPSSLSPTPPPSPSPMPSSTLLQAPLSSANPSPTETPQPIAVATGFPLPSQEPIHLTVSFHYLLPVDHLFYATLGHVFPELNWDNNQELDRRSISRKATCNRHIRQYVRCGLDDTSQTAEFRIATTGNRAALLYSLFLQHRTPTHSSTGPVFHYSLLYPPQNIELFKRLTIHVNRRGGHEMRCESLHFCITATNLMFLYACYPKYS